MVRPKHRKFIYTQLSAPLALIAGGAFALYAIKAFGLSALMTKEIYAILLMIFVFSFAIGTMLLWGKILVVLGILTKGEARGYPYSKPWE